MAIAWNYMPITIVFSTCLFGYSVDKCHDRGMSLVKLRPPGHDRQLLQEPAGQHEQHHASAAAQGPGDGPGAGAPQPGPVQPQHGVHGQLGPQAAGDPVPHRQPPARRAPRHRQEQEPGPSPGAEISVYCRGIRSVSISCRFSFVRTT